MPSLLPWASGLLIAAFALFIAYVVLLLYGNSLLAKEERNRLRNSFPYEFYKDFPVPYRILAYAVLALDIFLLALGFCFFFLSLETGYAYAVMLLWIVSAVALLCGNVLPLSRYKAHIIANLFAFFFFALGAILFCFFSVVPGALLLPSRLSLPILVLVGVVGFLGFFALLNPKLKDWYRLDRTEENGATYYVKPKVNYLALYEWIFLVLINLVAFLLFINIIVTGTVVY